MPVPSDSPLFGIGYTILRNFKSVAKKWLTEWVFFNHIFCTPPLTLNWLFLNVKRTLKKWSS